MDVVIAMTNIRAKHLKELGATLALFDRLFAEIADELKSLGTEPEDFAVWLYRFVLQRLRSEGPQPFRISPEWASDEYEAALIALVCLGEQYPHYQKAVVLKKCAKKWSRSQSGLIDLTYKQIAEILAEDPDNPPASANPSPGSVQNWYRRGLEKIEEYLINEGWL